MKTHSNDTFTPGPWTFHAPDGGDIQIRAADTDPIATMDMDYSKPSEAEANAHLIAAAPELLAALSYSLELMMRAEREVRYAETRSYLQDAMEKARAAIAKAKGS